MNFKGSPRWEKKRHKSQAFKSLPELIPIHFFAHKNGRIRDGPLEEGMSTMVPTNNSGMPEKKKGFTIPGCCFAILGGNIQS